MPVVLGLMRKRTHMALHVKQGEAYRADIEQLRYERDRANERLKQIVRDLGDVVDWRHEPDGRLRIMIEVDRRISHADAEVARACGEQLMHALYGMQRDYRGDMRAASRAL